MTKEKPTERELRWTLITIAVVILAAAGGGFVILALLPQKLLDDPYIVIVLLVAGFVSVTLLLYLGTIILRTAGLGMRGEALGMPEGSIRALIAMSLILIFAIIGVTVLYSGLGGKETVSKGITADEIDRLENVQIVGITVVAPAASPSPERFDVTARAELSQAGHDFGLQLLSTVSTLVVAVAGFYFGSRSVAQAAKTSNEAAAAALAASTAAADAAATAARAASGTAAADTVAATEEQPLQDDDIIGAVEDGEDVDAGDGVGAGEEAADATGADADAAADADAEAQASAEAKADDTDETATDGTPKAKP